MRGGAETLVLCDTNGGSLPWQIAEVVRGGEGRRGPPARHPRPQRQRDGGGQLAGGGAEGAVQVQGTINGYGERCGNANLCSVIPALELKLGKHCLPPGRLATLTEVSRFVAEVANLAPDEHLPYVGKSAFAHKGGIHVAAMRRNAATYQHVDPELVGNQMRVVVSELSGRGNMLSKAEEMGVAGGDVAGVLEEIKELEAEGLLVRGRRGLGGDADEAPGAGLPAALRAGRLPGQRRAPRPAAASSPRPWSRCGSTARCSTPPPRATARSTRSTPRCARRSGRATRRSAQIQLTDYKVRILDASAAPARSPACSSTRGRATALEHRRRLHQHHRGQLAGPRGRHRVRPHRRGADARDPPEETT